MDDEKPANKYTRRSPGPKCWLFIYFGLILGKFKSIKEKITSHTFTNEKGFPPGDSGLAKIMTTKEVSEYLKLHEITICRYAAKGIIPAIRIGRIWRFDRDVINSWIGEGQTETKADGKSKRIGVRKESENKKPKK
jgi:excisionase family DNA binding protein